MSWSWVEGGESSEFKSIPSVLDLTLSVVLMCCHQIKKIIFTWKWANTYTSRETSTIYTLPRFSSYQGFSIRFHLFPSPVLSFPLPFLHRVFSEDSQDSWEWCCARKCSVLCLQRPSGPVARASSLLNMWGLWTSVLASLNFPESLTTGLGA